LDHKEQTRGRQLDEWDDRRKRSLVGLALVERELQQLRRIREQIRRIGPAVAMRRRDRREVRADLVERKGRTGLQCKDVNHE
jgi:hypothetical protein